MINKILYFLILAIALSFFAPSMEAATAHAKASKHATVKASKKHKKHHKKAKKHHKKHKQNK